MASSGTIGELLVTLGIKPDASSIARAQSTISGVKQMANKALGVVGLTLTVAGITQFTKSCMQAASDAEQVKQKFDSAFAEYDSTTGEWIGSVIDDFKGMKNAAGEAYTMVDYAEDKVASVAAKTGRGVSDIRRDFADMSTLLVGMTDNTAESRKNVADLTEGITQTAIDLASAMNIEDAQALNNMQSYMMGQTRAGYRLGIAGNDSVYSETIRKLKQAGMIANDTAEKMSGIGDNYTKMLVRYYTAVDQSQPALHKFWGQASDTGRWGWWAKNGDQLVEMMDAIGDAQISLQEGQYESVLRVMNSQIKELKINLGNFINPYVSRVYLSVIKIVQRMNQLLPSMGDIKDETSKAYKLAQNVDKALDFIYERVRDVYHFVRDVVKVANDLAESIGGWGEALKIVASIIAVIKLAPIVRDIGTILSMVSMQAVKWGLILSTITAIVLAVDDFMTFMNSDNPNDSIIGRALGKDAGDVKEKLKQAKKDFEDGINNLRELFFGTGNESVGIADGIDKANTSTSTFADALRTVSQLVSDIAKSFKDITDYLNSITDNPLIKILSDGYNILANAWWNPINIGKAAVNYLKTPDNGNGGEKTYYWHLGDSMAEIIAGIRRNKNIQNGTYNPLEGEQDSVTSSKTATQIMNEAKNMFGGNNKNFSLIPETTESTSVSLPTNNASNGAYQLQTLERDTSTAVTNGAEKLQEYGKTASGTVDKVTDALKKLDDMNGKMYSYGYSAMSKYANGITSGSELVMSALNRMMANANSLVQTNNFVNNFNGIGASALGASGNVTAKQVGATNAEASAFFHN